MPYVNETQDVSPIELPAVNDGQEREAAEQNLEQQYSGPLLKNGNSDKLRAEWEAIQTAFVDDPRGAVKDADKLVASAIQQLADSFSEQRAKLEHEWSKGNEVSTENLRQVIRQYRAFFHRLLAI